MTRRSDSPGSSARTAIESPLSPIFVAERLPAMRLSRSQKKRLAAYGQIEWRRWMMPEDMAQAASALLGMATIACLASAGGTGWWLALFEVRASPGETGGIIKVVRVGSWAYGEREQ